MSEPGDGGRRHPWLAYALWLPASLLGTICGVGGGIFATPILHYLMRLPLQLAVGTSLVLVLAMTVVATVAEFARSDSALDWAVVGLLLLGSIPGAQLGYRFSRRVDARTLKAIFVFVMLGAALRTATIHGAGGEHAQVSLLELDPLHVALVALVGVVGGFLAPLLGVGGGIFVIPALLVALPGVGYLEVRACSMAMSIVNAAQSVWLHLRGGTVHLRTALPFGVLAVLGAVLGVMAVHLQGWDEVARIAMSLVLVLVAARFAWDVRAMRRNAEPTER